MSVVGDGSARAQDVTAIVKDAVLAGIVTFALALPMVGFEIIDISGGGIGLNYRFGEVAVAVIAVMAGRVGMSLIRLGHPIPVLVAASATTVGAVAGPWGGAPITVLISIAAVVLALRAAAGVWRLRRSARRIVLPPGLAGQVSRLAPPAFLVLAIVFPFLPIADQRLLDIAVLVVTYVMLGWGLNIVVGLAGLLDLGYVAFYAVGAYTFGLLAQHADFSFWMALPIGGALAAFMGLILGFPVLRLRGDYLAIVTLGFGEIIRIILQNWYEVTGGPNGIANIPRPTFFGLRFLPEPAEEGEHTFATFFGLDFSPSHRVIFLYFIVLTLALVVNLFTQRIRRLPIGRAWEALREDEIACRSLGINPTNTKLSAFSIGAMFAGFAGCFFAARQGFISPESFTFIESAVILAIVVLGGMGSQLGIVLAAVVLIGMPEFLRDLNQYRMLAFGAGMVAIMIWRPLGLLSHREPTIRLDPREGGR